MWLCSIRSTIVLSYFSVYPIFTQTTLRGWASITKWLCLWNFRFWTMAISQCHPMLPLNKLAMTHRVYGMAWTRDYASTHLLETKTAHVGQMLHPWGVNQGPSIGLHPHNDPSIPYVNTSWATGAASLYIKPIQPAMLTPGDPFLCPVHIQASRNSVSDDSQNPVPYHSNEAHFQAQHPFTPSEIANLQDAVLKEVRDTPYSMHQDIDKGDVEYLANLPSMGRSNVSVHPSSSKSAATIDPKVCLLLTVKAPRKNVAVKVTGMSGKLELRWQGELTGLYSNMAADDTSLLWFGTIQREPWDKPRYLGCQSYVRPQGLSET